MKKNQLDMLAKEKEEKEKKERTLSQQLMDLENQQADIGRRNQIKQLIGWPAFQAGLKETTQALSRFSKKYNRVISDHKKQSIAVSTLKSKLELYDSNLDDLINKFLFLKELYAEFPHNDVILYEYLMAIRDVRKEIRSIQKNKRGDDDVQTLNRLRLLLKRVPPELANSSIVSKP